MTWIVAQHEAPCRAGQLRRWLNVKGSPPSGTKTSTAAGPFMRPPRDQWLVLGYQT